MWDNGADGIRVDVSEMPFSLNGWNDDCLYFDEAVQPYNVFTLLPFFLSAHLLAHCIK